jgi:hypothetical protein
MHGLFCRPQTCDCFECSPGSYSSPTATSLTCPQLGSSNAMCCIPAACPGSSFGATTLRGGFNSTPLQGGPTKCDQCKGGCANCPECSQSNNLWLVFHANLAGTVSGLDGSVVCFYSTITDPFLPQVYKSTTCWTLQTKAATPYSGSPFNVTLDPVDSKNTLIGLIRVPCGSQACPGNAGTALQPTWYMEVGLLRGSVSISGSWQWSMGAYQVDDVDLGSTYLRSSCNGYPLSQTRCHVAGGLGGGGSNYCGGWVGSSNVCPAAGAANSTAPASNTGCRPGSSPNPLPR